MKMIRPCCDALRSSCAALRTLCFDVVTINGIFDALTVVASAADQITDLLVLYQFYVDGLDTFFILSLCIILLAQLTFAFTFTIERAEVRGDTWRAHRRRIVIFVCVFPLAHLVPILAYLTSTFELPRLQRLLKRFGVGGESEPRPPGTTSWEKVKNKMHAHRGFLLEAFAEAIPQCAVQLVAALTVDHFTTLSAISIFLSISVIASKSWVVAWSPHAPTMAFNTFCIVADIVGFFASLAWLFAIDPLPAVHEMHQSLRGWMLGVVSLTAVSGALALGLFSLGVLFDELRFQTSLSARARGPRRHWPKKVLWAPPAMVPFLYALVLVPIAVIYLLARWTLLALFCGTMGQQEKEKLHRGSVDKMLTYIEQGTSLSPRRSFGSPLGVQGAVLGALRSRRLLLRQSALPRGTMNTPRRIQLSSMIDSAQVQLPAWLSPVAKQELRGHALCALLRLAIREHKQSLKGLPSVARQGMQEHGREILAMRVALAGHRGAPGTAFSHMHETALSHTPGTALSHTPADAAVHATAEAASRRSTSGSRLSLWPASTRNTSTSSRPGAQGGVASAALVNEDMARGLESRSLRWLVLVLVRCGSLSQQQRSNAKLTLQTQSLSPCSDGRLSGLLQACAALLWFGAMVTGVLCLVISIPLLVLSVIFPLLQPILYGAARRSDDGRDWPPPPILAPVLSVCCFLCVVALPPLRLSRRSSLRIQLSEALIELCDTRRFTDAMLITIEERCSVAAAAAAEEERLEAQKVPRTEEACRRRRLERVPLTEEACRRRRLERVPLTEEACRRRRLERVPLTEEACRRRRLERVPLTEEACRRRRLERVRFDDDCSLCCRKVVNELGVRLFLDAAFLGPRLSNGGEVVASLAAKEKSDRNPKRGSRSMTTAAAAGRRALVMLRLPWRASPSTAPSSTTTLPTTPTPMSTAEAEQHPVDSSTYTSTTSASPTMISPSHSAPSSATPAPLPHLPEGIRRLIYAYARVEATDAAITLSCGHRFHRVCLECTPLCDRADPDDHFHALGELGLPPPTFEERESVRNYGNSAQGALGMFEQQPWPPQCPECATLVEAATCIWAMGSTRTTRNDRAADPLPE